MSSDHPCWTPVGRAPLGLDGIFKVDNVPDALLAAQQNSQANVACILAKRRKRTVSKRTFGSAMMMAAAVDLDYFKIFVRWSIFFHVLFF